METVGRGEPVRGAVPAWAVAVLVAAAAIAPYLPGLPGEFVYDDDRLIVQNDGLRRPFEPGRAFLRDYYASDLDREGLGYYRPLALLSNEADFRRGGGEPLSFHLTNLLLHALSSLLVLALARRVIGEGAAAAAALLFAVHPAHAESVAFISGRVDPLATLFALGAVVLHLRANVASRPIALRVGAGLSWLAALLSKEMAVTAPALALLVEWALEGTPGREGWRARARRYLPYAVALAVYLSLRAVAFGGLLVPGGTGASFSPARTLVVLGSYLGWLGMPPWGLHLEPSPAQGARALLPVLGVVAAVAAALLLARRKKAIEAALLGWCLVSLLPVSQLRPLETVLSERFLYLPSVAAMLLVSTVALRPAGKRARIAGAVGLLLLGAAYVGILIPRARTWRHEISLWSAKAREDPASIKAHLNLGRAHARVGNREAARESFGRARALGIDEATLGGEMASLLGEGAPEDRIEAIRAALRASPADGALWHNLGFFLLDRGEAEEALAAFREALRLVPARPETWLGKAMASLRTGDLESAGEAAAEAARLKPDLGLARAVLAECALRAGNGCEALRIASGVQLDDPTERERLARLVERARSSCGEEGASRAPGEGSAPARDLP